jgi:hypothetical protein
MLGNLGNMEGTQWQHNGNQKIQTIYTHYIRWLFACFFHETQWFFEVLEIIGTDGSLILDFFVPSTQNRQF